MLKNKTGLYLRYIGLVQMHLCEFLVKIVVGNAKNADLKFKNENVILIVAI